jgi:hypothetical protein
VRSFDDINGLMDEGNKVKERTHHEWRWIADNMTLCIMH